MKLSRRLAKSNSRARQRRRATPENMNQAVSSVAKTPPREPASDLSPPNNPRRQRKRGEEADVKPGVQPKPFAYRSQRSDTDATTGRKQPRESSDAQTARPGWLSRVGAIVLSFAALAAAINLLTLSSQTSVSVIKQDGQAGSLMQDKSVYQQAASDLFADSVWNRNKITVNTGAVERQMEQQFPELNNVAITIPWLTHRPVVHIEPAAPGLVVKKSDQAWLLDDQGRVLVKANDESELPASDGLLRVNDQSGLQAATGEQVIPAQQIRFMETVVAQLAARQYTVSELILPAASSQLDVKLVNEPFQVKFNLQSNTAREQAGTFLATIAKLKKENAIPGQYIDVRVPGRAYYQ